jgi:transposase InsO family protein
LISAALSAAGVDQRGPVNTVVHGDRAANFVPGPSSGRWRTTASPARWAASAPAATTPPWSRSALLQKKVLNRQQWRTREDLRLPVVTWIERTYHRRRRQRALGNLTPIEFGLLHHQLATTA